MRHCHSFAPFPEEPQGPCISFDSHGSTNEPKDNASNPSGLGLGFALVDFDNRVVGSESMPVRIPNLALESC